MFSQEVTRKKWLIVKLYFTLPYFHNKTHWQQHNQQIQSCYSMSIGCCLGNSILISLLDNLCEFLDTSWKCSHKMIQYSCSFHNKPCMQWCNILVNHCRNIINHGHFSCSYILLSHWVYICHWASENGPS